MTKSELTVNDAIQQFVNNTSLHGAPRIFRSRSLRKRLFWLFVFLGASTMFGFQLSQLLIKYFAYVKRFNIDVRKEEAVFPLVTICNMRPFDVTTLRNVYSVFAVQNNTERKALAESLDNKFIESLVTLHDVIENLTSLDYFSLADLWSAQLLVDFDQAVIDTGLTKRNNFIIDCFDSVNKSTCNESRFTSRLVYDGIFVSQCYTYNMSTFSDKLQSSRRRYISLRHRIEWIATIIDGHGLLPPIESGRNISYMIDRLFSRSLGREGVEVYIHQQGSQPNLIDQGRHVYVPPGHVAQFVVNMRSTEMYNVPQSNCLKDYPFSPHPAGVYEQTSCYYACLQNRIIAECKCKSPELSNDSDYPEVAFCFSLRQLVDYMHGKDLAALSLTEIRRLFNETIKRISCSLNELDNEAVHATCDSSCPRACTEVVYDYDIRLIKWPHRNTVVYHIGEKFITDLASGNDTERFELFKNYFEFAADERQPEFIDFNYQKMVNEMSVLQVEMKTLDLTKTLEVADYTGYQLLSDIGGQLGLWIGMSVITVTEVVDLWLNIMKLLLVRCRRYICRYRNIYKV